jgi:hypothetical protein
LAIVTKPTDSNNFFADTNAAELTTTVEEIKTQEVKYEGRRQRTNTLEDRMRQLNEKQDEWKYSLAETFNDPLVPSDSVDMLMNDGFTVVDSASAEKLLGGFKLRGQVKLMRIEKGQSEAYRKEAIELATRPVAIPEGAVVDGQKQAVERKLVTISGG